MDKKRILLVDDTPSLLKLGMAIFESDGYEVLTAIDGVEALEILSHNTVSLIITDILMPNMDGYSLCYKIRDREKNKDTPIIVYSATYTSKSDEALALEIGADMFIRKPAAIKVLLDAAKELIEAPTRQSTALQEHDLSDVMRQYNSRLIEKLEEKNYELVQAQADLLKSERQFRALIENNFDAITLREASGKLLYQSPSTERITGYTLEEANGLKASDFIHPDDAVAINKVAESCMENPGKPIFGMYRLRHKQGHYIWLEGTVTNMLADENIRALVGNFRDITDRKLAEEKIIHANRLYAFVSTINQAIVHIHDEHVLFSEACRIAVDIGKFDLAWIATPDKANQKLDFVAQNNATDVDLAFLNNFGYAEHGPIGQVLKSGEYYAVNDFEIEIPCTTKTHAIHRGFKSFIALPIKKNGQTVNTFNLYSAQTNFFDGQEIKLLKEVSGDISFALDIFEKENHRKQMADKIANNELRLKHAQSIAHFGSWVLNFTTGIAEWSDEACRIYGISEKENIQSYQSWVSFIHPDDLEYVMDVTREGAKKFSSSAFYHRIVRKDGTIRHIYSQAEFEFDIEGKPIGLYGVAHDVTEAKEAEKALAQSEANLRIIMDLMPQSIFAKDYNGRYLFVNKSFADLYGLTPGQLVNRTVDDAIPVKGESLVFLRQDQEVISSGLTKTIPEHDFTDYKGNLRTFFTTKVPFTVAGTNERAVLGIAVDITARKRAEVERAKMVADIVQRNKGLEQFSYIVSHNLRAPVANISGLAEILKLSSMDKDEMQSLISDLSESVKKLDDVIMDLNYTLQVKHTENRSKEIIRFSDLIKNIKLSIDNLIRNEHVQIACDFSEVDEMLTIKSYLYSILFNLISNSIKYRQSHLPPIIEITSVREGDKIKLFYKDNGLGIDLKERGDQVFGLYKRFHGHVDGKGMGLFMVKTQVESLGGKITIASEVNVGTEFRIEFEANQ